MKKLQLRFTYYMLNKFHHLAKAGLSVPLKFSDRLWKFVISKNLLKLKAPEAANGCCEKE